MTLSIFSDFFQKRLKMSLTVPKKDKKLKKKEITIKNTIKTSFFVRHTPPFFRHTKFKLGTLGT